MDNLQKQIWHDRLLAVVWASCGILPLPFGAFASDRPYVASASILAFLSYPLPFPYGWAIDAVVRAGTAIMRHLGRPCMAALSSCSSLSACSTA